MKTLQTLMIAGALIVAGKSYAQKENAHARPRAQVGESVSGAPGTYTKNSFPDSFVSRPMTLPEGMVQADSTLAISNYDTGFARSDTGTNMNLGVDVGLHPRLQAGMLLSLPLTPEGGFGMMVGDLQYALAPFANLRFDVGASRLLADVPAMGNMTVTQSTTGFVWGVGVPMKWRLSDRVAVISGRTTASSFGTASKANGYLVASDDIITMTSGSFTSGNATFTSTLWTFGLPVGILTQVHERIGLAVRTGFRVLRGDVLENDTAIPFAFDLMTHVARPVDVGFTFELPGWTSDYGAIKNANLWAQARF
jgi:hypothetical protein